MKNKFNLIVAVLGVLLIFAAVSCAAPCTDPGSIKRVKNTRIGNYEYVVFDYVLPGTPTYTVTSATPPFTQDPSGNPVTVAGSKFREIRFDSVVWTCSINETFSLPKLAIRGIGQTSQFEGIVSYVVGYRNASKYVTSYSYDAGSIKKVVMKFKR
jgi:hypothetical protein